MILAFYGDGKGKTTAAIGTILRSLHLGKRVGIIQFFKNNKNYYSNEILFLEKLNIPNLIVKQFGKKKGWLNFEKPNKEDIRKAKEGALMAKELLQSKSVDVLVLDEFLLCEYFHLLPKQECINLFEYARSKKIDIILTGRRFDKKLIPYIDCITEMHNVKHPYDRGVSAKEGIDY
jgi:cob(I)alamin adenosyltransferase